MSELLLSGAVFTGLGAFNPKLILLQWGTLQSCYWSILAFTLRTFTHATTVGHLFGEDWPDMTPKQKFLRDLCILAISILFLGRITAWAVQRARKCWDFILTVHITDLMVRSIEWTAFSKILDYFSVGGRVGYFASQCYM